LLDQIVALGVGAQQPVQDRLDDVADPVIDRLGGPGVAADQPAADLVVADLGVAPACRPVGSNRQLP